MAVASSTGFVKKSPVVTPQATATKQLAVSASAEKPSGDKVQPASSDGDKPAPATVRSKVKVEEEEGGEKKEEVAVAPEVIVEDTATSPEGTGKSAESADSPVDVKPDALSVAVKKTDSRPKSRSGSPANMASPAAVMKPIVSTSSLVQPAGTLAAAGSLRALPGMLPGTLLVHICAGVLCWKIGGVL